MTTQRHNKVLQAYNKRMELDKDCERSKRKVQHSFSMS